ncbi:MAG TPA: hypothetical protein VNX68_15520, partial [Nitrosopumilaceae archaeon]|nr:hypothetical protein [Nitrosopumilaceae archaeon]
TTLIFCSNCHSRTLSLMNFQRCHFLFSTRLGSIHRQIDEQIKVSNTNDYDFLLLKYFHGLAMKV